MSDKDALVSDPEQEKCGHCGLPIHPSDPVHYYGWFKAHHESRCRDLLQAEIKRLSDALTAQQPQSEAQEPVAYRTYDRNGYYVVSPNLEEAERDFPGKVHQPLYTTPPTAQPAMLRAAEIARANWTGNRNQSDYEQGWDAACEKLEARFRAEAAAAGDVVAVPVEPIMGQWDDFCAAAKITVPFEAFRRGYKAMLAAAKEQKPQT